MHKMITPWGRRCKSQMILLPKTLTELARETGYTTTYVSSIINGRVVAPPETAEKISAALNVDIPYDVA